MRFQFKDRCSYNYGPKNVRLFLTHEVMVSILGQETQYHDQDYSIAFLGSLR
jgi:hypothetical protein